MVLAASGLRDVVPLLVGALVISVVFHDGRIERLGPLTFQPAITVMTLVPIILAVACATSHATARTPVIARVPRVHLARALSYLTVLALSTLILALGTALAGGQAWAASIRNLLLLTGLTLLVGTLTGLVYGWIPAIAAFGASVLSSATDNPWTPYGLMLRETATTAQLVAAAVVCLTGLAVAVWDPRSPGYLRNHRPASTPSHGSSGERTSSALSRLPPRR